MSLRLGNKIIAGVGTHTKYNAHSLLDFKWTDHILNEMSWLRADTFTWQSGDVYTSVYNLLVEEYNNGTLIKDEGAPWYLRGPNGFKICTAGNNEQEIENLYNSTGVAWYYILDVENRRFKLPRTKYGFTGLRDSVGNYVPESLPNIRASLNNYQNKTGVNASPDSALYFGSSSNSLPVGASSAGFVGLYFDASRSSSTYQDNAPVQERATQMYLYFYVGEFSQTATEQTAGITTEVLNSKADDSAVVHKTGAEKINGDKTFTQQPRYTGTTAESSSQDSTALATVGYLNNPSKSLNVVHKTGNETITGQKTFTTETIHHIGSGNGQLRLYDGSVSTILRNDGFNTYILLTDKNNPSGSWNNLRPITINNISGVVTTTASDVNGSILTTVNKSKAANGYFKLGNGMIVQWGECAVSDGGSTSVTFPTPFTATPKISGNYYNSTGTHCDYYSVNIMSPSKTGFVFNTRCAGTWRAATGWWLAIGY